MSVLTSSEDQVAGAKGKPQTEQAFRIVVTNVEYGELCRGAIRNLRQSSRLNLDLLTFASWGEVKVPPATGRRMPTVFVSRLADIVKESAKKAQEVERPKYLLFSEGMPVEALASRLPQLNIRDAHRLHIARERSPKAISDILHRLIAAKTQPKATPSILDAWVEGKELVLLSPSFERISVPVQKLVRSIGKVKKDIRTFDIDEDGSFLYWPHADAHLGWEQVARIVDPAAALSAQQKTDRFNQGYGAAVRSLRRELGIPQSGVDGLTERHLRRIEQGKQSVTSSALRSLAKSHDMPVGDYMKEIAKRM